MTARRGGLDGSAHQITAYRRSIAQDARRSAAPAPLMKWAGGKRQLVPNLRCFIPAKFGHYYEPFVGGGALFFALRASGWTGRATLGDANELLVRTYLGVRNDVEGVIEALRPIPYDKEEYYVQRDVDPSLWNHKDDVDVAWWFIYMNKCCFNGLWRVNKAGRFNVPFGRYTNPTICDADGLRAASAALKGAVFHIGDFETTVSGAEKGDVVYFDPPYVPASKTSDFTAYTRDGFTFSDQRRLAACARRLKALGVRVILSNSDTPAVRQLYEWKGFTIRPVKARRNINSNASRRGAVGEVIIT